jgi:uncharacterized protein YndB with AHSA1/START domain
MAKVNMSVELPASPEKAWAVMSDMSRFEDWLSIHQGWRSELPAEIGVGSKMTEIVSVMGMANKIEWTVNTYQPPALLEISGTGMAGVKVSLSLSVTPGGTGSLASIDAEFSGQMVVGPIGTAVEKSTKAELAKSLAELTKLVA